MWKLIFCTISIVLNLSTSLSAELSEGQNVFSIPAYPGTENYPGNTSEFSQLHPPSATILKVYKTNNGQPLDTDAVIKFYEEYYGQRGWREGVDKNQADESFISLQIQVYEPNGELASKHVSGKLYLWVAPTDGMVTIYMSQWRGSSLSQDSRSKYEQVEENLIEIAGKHNYTITKAFGFSNWPEYYQSENLVDCKVFGLQTKSSPSRGCLDRTGRLTATLLAYSDSVAAREQAVESSEPQIFWEQSHFKQLGNIVLRIDNADTTQVSVVRQMLEDVKLEQKIGESSSSVEQQIPNMK